MSSIMPTEALRLLELSKLEEKRLELACNENVLSETATQLLSSPAASRYYFKVNNNNLSDFPEFAAPGSPEVDDIFDKARRAVMDMTGADYVNLAPLSGIHAMIMVIVALTAPGETILSLDPHANGHFATQSVVESLGRKSAFVPRRKNGEIDTDGLRELVAQGAKMLYLDLATHLEPISAKEVKRIFGDKLMTVCDASHSLGLIMGGQFQAPFSDGFDVVCANTHKTFPGPHRGIILAKDDALGDQISAAVDSKLYSSVHFGSLLAMAMTIFEMQSFGRQYAEVVVNNSARLTKNLEDSGFTMGKCYDGSPAKNQHVHITYRERDEAHNALTTLLKNHIVAHLCYTEREGYIVRFGTQEVTRRGMNEDDMDQIADIIKLALRGEDMTGKVESLVSQYPTVHFSFDNATNVE